MTAARNRTPFWPPEMAPYLTNRRQRLLSYKLCLSVADLFQTKNARLLKLAKKKIHRYGDSNPDPVIESHIC